MFLLTLAATAALTQWSREGQEIYTGPGWFCGGGYRIHLSTRDRVVAQPQAGGAAGAQLQLNGHQVSIWTGVQGGPGPVVSRFRGGVIHQGNDGPNVVYTVSDQTPYGVRVTSDAFRGFKRDAWFFSRANFDSDQEEAVRCLAAETER
jgi:hypothetical protein